MNGRILIQWPFAVGGFYAWGPSIPSISIVHMGIIQHMGTIHPYCTHGDHPSLLYTWGPSIPIVHMGTIHPYCTHGDHPSYGDHPSLLYTWIPSFLIVHMKTVTQKLIRVKSDLTGSLSVAIIDPAESPLVAKSDLSTNSHRFKFFLIILYKS